ncbi:hypothetical protein U91I_01821 [alpha proteobacterium U9-1i]|nr:hypothetical protein U91I_01821 [alpha proteobacterium U9-1i]
MFCTMAKVSAKFLARLLARRLARRRSSIRRHRRLAAERLGCARARPTRLRASAPQFRARIDISVAGTNVARRKRDRRIAFLQDLGGLRASRKIHYDIRPIGALEPHLRHSGDSGWAR